MQWSCIISFHKVIRFSFCWNCFRKVFQLSFWRVWCCWLLLCYTDFCSNKFKVIRFISIIYTCVFGLFFKRSSSNLNVQQIKTTFEMLHKENEKKMWMLSGCFEKQQEQPDLQPSNTGLILKWTYKKTWGKCELSMFPPIGLE